MANPFQKYAQPAGEGVIFRDPTAPAQERRAEEDQALQRAADARAEEQLRLAQEAAARNAANDAIAREEKAVTIDDKRTERERLDRAQGSGISDSLEQIRNVIQAARDARTMAASGAGIGSWEGSQGFRDSTALSIIGANSASNDMEALLNTIGSNTAFDRLQKMRDESPTGGALGAVSEIELRLLRDSIASLSQKQSEAQFRSNMDKVIAAYTRVAGKLDAADRYYRETGSMDGFTPPTEEELARFTLDDPVPQDPRVAGAGATQEGIPIPPEYQERHLAYLRDNWGGLTPDGYAQFRAGLDNEYDVGSPNIEAYRNVVEDLNAMASEGQPPEAAGAVPSANRDLSAFDQLRNDVAVNPWGTAAANALDLGGAVNWLSDGRVQASSELNPKAAFAGDMVSGMTGAGLTGSALSLSAKLAPKATFLGDALYGTVDGAMSDDDIIAGALTGLTSAVAGDQAGKYIGRGIGRLRAGESSLSDGQQAIAQTVRGAGDNAEQQIVNALTRADNLSVPMTLADASPELGSLAGSAVRFSPTTAGNARTVMAMRNQGQLDRLAEAVERDLGPVTNIPQRSEDLLQQARTAAGPLYDAAYAADGFDRVYPNISPLLSRPSMRASLSRARRIAEEEGRDPNALGLVMNDAGQVFLHGPPELEQGVVRAARENLDKTQAAYREIPPTNREARDRGAQAIRDARERLSSAEAGLAAAPQMGDEMVRQMPTWQTLDYVKRGIDDVLEGYRDKTTGKLRLDEEGRAIDATRRAFLSNIDEVNPDYAAARATYAGPAQARDQLRMGQQAYTIRPNELGVNVADASDEQMGQMRLGFQSELMERSGNLRNNSNPWAQLNTPNTEGRLNVLYGDAEDANIARLLSQRDLELQLAGSANRLIGNSATAEREIADEFFKQQPGIGGDLAAGIVETGALGAPFLTVGKSIGDRVFRERRERAALDANRALADEIGPLLLDTSSDQLTAMLAEDRQYADELARLLASGETLGRRIGTGFGTATADRVAY